MTFFQRHIETSARTWVKEGIDNGILGQPVGETIAILRDMLSHLIAANPGMIDTAYAENVVVRVEQILTDMHAYLDSGNGCAMIEKYYDCMPDELRASIFAKAKEVLRNSGVQFAEYRDETGEVFLRCEGLEKLGVPPDETARMHEMSGDLPTPVGKLHRVQ